MVKKLIYVVVAFLVLIVAALVALPVVFKDDIIALAKAEANKQVNAQIDFGEMDISIFPNFPDFTLSIQDVSVQGIEAFEGITLTRIDELIVSLDLMSVIQGEKIQINTIGLERPYIHVLVLPDGRANYDIAVPGDEVEETDAEASASFDIGLQSYFIRHAHVIYDDRAGGMFAELVDFTHEGTGDFTQDDVFLETRTTASALTYRQDAVAYLNRAKLDMDLDLDLNLPQMRFEFGENHVQLNALHLAFEGMMAMPDEAGSPIDMDLRFATTVTTFSSILSMVPGAYMEGFEEVETEGKFAFSGMAKGRMIGDTYPAFSVDLTVNDGRFHYPDMPKSAEEIQVDLHVKNPGGSDDLTVIDLNRFHTKLAGNPIDMVLHMRTPLSDPYIDASVQMNLDLASIGDVIPLEDGQALRGQVFADLSMKGHQSAIDEERYQDFEAGGSLVLNDFDYADPSMPYATVIETCSLNFSPRFAELTAFAMKLGDSDIRMTGRVDNIVEWYVADAPIHGTMNLSSSKLDLDQLMQDSGEASASESEEESVEVLEVPTGFDFVLNCAIDDIRYDGLTVNNFRGKVVLREGAISLDHVLMELLGGSLNMTGRYATTNPIEPDFDFSMDIIGWDIVETYTYLDMAKQVAPIMEHATGRFSTELVMSGLMDQHMDPKYSSLDGRGALRTRGVEIDAPPVLDRIATAIKYDGVKQLNLDDVTVNYSFEDGRVHVKPTSFVIGKEVPSKFSGSHGFDQSLDYDLNLDVPSRLMGSAANQVVSGLLAQANQALGTNASVPERVLIDVAITGMVGDPKVTPRIAGTEAGDAAAGLKQQGLDALNEKKEELEARAKAELEKAKAEAEAKVKAEAEKAKQRAQEEADKAKAKAQQEAEAAKKRLEEEKKKAEEEARRKAEEAKKKAEEEAKKNLNKLFK